MKSILSNVPHDSTIHIAVARQFQRSYFRQSRRGLSFDRFLAKNAHLRNSVIYRLDRGGFLQEFGNMANRVEANSAERLILFLETVNLLNT